MADATPAVQMALDTLTTQAPSLASAGTITGETDWQPNQSTPDEQFARFWGKSDKQGNPGPTLQQNSWDAYNALIQQYPSLQGQILNPDALAYMSWVKGGGIDNAIPGSQWNIPAVQFQMYNMMFNQPAVVAARGGSFVDTMQQPGAADAIAQGSEQALANFNNAQKYNSGRFFGPSGSFETEFVPAALFVAAVMSAGTAAGAAGAAEGGAAAGGAVEGGAAAGGAATGAGEAATQSTLQKIGLGSLKGAGIGAGLGGASAGLQGGDVLKGAERGAIGGAISGGVGAGVSALGAPGYVSSGIGGAAATGALGGTGKQALTSGLISGTGNALFGVPAEASTGEQISSTLQQSLFGQGVNALLGSKYQSPSFAPITGAGAQPGSAALAQALNVGDAGGTIFGGSKDGNKKNVWNVESLRLMDSSSGT